MAQSRGTCALCGYESSKAGITRHLATCLSEHDVGKGKAARLFRLRIEDPYTPFFWLDVEAKAEAPLSDLDRFLRDIWLECCGHLSLFQVGNTQYHISDDLAEEDESLDDLIEMFPSANRAGLEAMLANRVVNRSMKTKLGDAVRPGSTFTHEYDFGSTTELKLKVVSEREGKIGRETVRLLARNTPPEWTCITCGKAATQIHTEELWDSENPFYCDKHAKNKDYFYLPIVNSPRMGICGYAG